MTFGELALDAAEGAILAHSLKLASGTVSKGTVLGADHLQRLKEAGIESVIAARLEPGDVPEDDAAGRIASRLVAPGLNLAKAFTGRANLVAGRSGIVMVNAGAVHAMNQVDEGITLATLPDMMRVHQGQLVATIKVIPYAVAAAQVDTAVEVLGAGALRLAPFRPGRVQLILTRLPGFKESLLEKGKVVVEDRVCALGLELADVAVVAHRTEEIARALDPEMDLILILGASATSDRADVAPAAVSAAGGAIQRFGMPVDPGNLLFLADLKGASVVGLPGCARSPAMNGVDWVLERLAAGVPVDGEAIAAMGVGGLLKEMPGRPQPRQPKR
ncbi:MAG: molybdopterin-binding protein [Boseongicola sp. SB0664_bin_43]|uniref:Molybdopterin-binding protein n=1 Tax=Boseongicola sp. SB0664_bin_43 TaxID=2604844 RepID=A0A6B0XZ67_9RHOB|nr:molybdopterin-binding protein [Boseongicola sp. SB0664_bin_43]